MSTSKNLTATVAAAALLGALGLAYAQTSTDSSSTAAPTDAAVTQQAPNTAQPGGMTQTPAPADSSTSSTLPADSSQSSEPAVQADRG